MSKKLVICTDAESDIYFLIGLLQGVISHHKAKQQIRADFEPRLIVEDF